MRVKNAITVGIANYLEAIVSVLVIVALAHSPCAQQAQTVTLPQSSDEHVQRVIASLEPDNTLRVALERGDRGRGAHMAWMDKMRRLGVKQAAYKIRFVWGTAYKKLDIQDSTYLSHYYRFDSKISDKSTLKQIGKNGLEKALAREILFRARQNLNQRASDFHSKWLCGLLYLNLLDDEVLPILDEPADIYRTNERDCRRYR
jgi:alanine racemase